MSPLPRLWISWEELHELLCCMAKESRLPVWQQEYATQAVSLGLVNALRSPEPPHDVLAYAVVSMRRTLNQLRKRGTETTGLDLEPHAESEGNTGAEVAHLSHDEFWDWVHDNRPTIEPLLTALEWTAMLVTEAADTITEAADRLDRTPRDYRNLRNRGSKKLFRKIIAGFVPPPLLIGEETMVWSSAEPGAVVSRMTKYSN